MNSFPFKGLEKFSAKLEINDLKKEDDLKLFLKYQSRC